MKKTQKSQVSPEDGSCLRVYAVKTLELDYLTLRDDAKQENGHSTAGYSLAMLTKDPNEAFALLLNELEPNAVGNYNLELVRENSILMWTPTAGGPPDYGAIVEIRPFELTYIPADSPEHAWEILGLEKL